MLIFKFCVITKIKNEHIFDLSLIESTAILIL